MGNFCCCCCGPEGYPPLELGDPPQIGSFFPNGSDTSPLLMVQTTAAIGSCANLQSDWENIYFFKSYMIFSKVTYSTWSALSVWAQNRISM